MSITMKRILAASAALSMLAIGTAIAASSAQVSGTVGSMAGIAQHLESLAGSLDRSVRRFQIA